LTGSDTLARRQHRAFSHQQAIELGATRRIIQRRRDNGAWVVLDHHVYALPSHPFTWLRQAKAAELRFPDAGVSGRPSAVLHAVGDVRAGGVEVTVPRGRGRAHTPLARVRQRDGIAMTTISGIRVVTIAECLADLAGLGDPFLLERAVDDALLRRSTTVDALLDHHAVMVARRQRGARSLASVPAERHGEHVPPTNELEAVLYRLLDQLLGGGYVRQSPFPWWPDAPQRVDAYVPAWRRIIEADGRAWHARHRDFERDRRRDHLAQRNGIEVTRFTYRQLVHEPGYVLDLLRALGPVRSSGAAVRRAA